MTYEYYTRKECMTSIKKEKTKKYITKNINKKKRKCSSPEQRRGMIVFNVGRFCGDTL